MFQASIDFLLRNFQSFGQQLASLLAIFYTFWLHILLYVLQDDHPAALAHWEISFAPIFVRFLHKSASVDSGWGVKWCRVWDFLANWRVHLHQGKKNGGCSKMRDVVLFAHRFLDGANDLLSLLFGKTAE